MGALLLLVCFLTQTPDLLPSIPITNDLGTIRKDLEAIDYLDGRQYHFGSDAYRAQTKVALLKRASEIHGTPVTSYEQLVQISTPTPTLADKLLGFFTFLHIVEVTAAIIIVLGLCYLLGPILIHLPGVFWETLCYVGCAVTVFTAHYLSPDFQSFLFIPGCYALVGAISLTHALHFPEAKRYSLGALICAICWGCVAVFYQSEIIGFSAVLAVLTSLGFFGAVGPLCVWIGFDDDDLMPRATIAALCLLIVNLVATIFGVSLQQFEVFRSGMSFLGTFVYFLGITIMASSYYWWRSENVVRYWSWQVVAVVSGILTIYFGLMFNLPSLTGVGGTFFYLYLLEKYGELPLWRSGLWPVGLIGLGGVLYALVWFAQMHPQYFIFMPKP